MDNASDALDILEEKLTQAILKIKGLEIENQELRKILSDKKDKERYYSNIQKENTQLRELISKRKNNEENIRNIENENSRLKSILKKAQDNEINYKYEIDRLIAENNDLKKIRDVVKQRVISLIKRLENENEQTSISELTGLSSDNNSNKSEAEKIENTKENTNEKALDIKESISLFDDEEGTSFDYEKSLLEKNHASENQKYNDDSINFFVEEDEDSDDDNQNKLF